MGLIGPIFQVCYAFSRMLACTSFGAVALLHPSLVAPLAPRDQVSDYEYEYDHDNDYDYDIAIRGL